MSALCLLRTYCVPTAHRATHSLCRPVRPTYLPTHRSVYLGSFPKQKVCISTNVELHELQASVVKHVPAFSLSLQSTAGTPRKRPWLCVGHNIPCPLTPQVPPRTRPTPAPMQCRAASLRLGTASPMWIRQLLGQRLTLSATRATASGSSSGSTTIALWRGCGTATAQPLSPRIMRYAGPEHGGQEGEIAFAGGGGRLWGTSCPESPPNDMWGEQPMRSVSPRASREISVRGRGDGRDRGRFATPASTGSRNQRFLKRQTVQ